MKLLVFLHRWLGVILGSFFAMWFLTGIVMMYVPFPSLSDDVRRSYLAPVSTATLVITPAQAIDRCELDTLTAFRLISILERPAYICVGSSSTVKAIYADTGMAATPLDSEAAEALTRRITSKPVAKVSKTEYDQWTVHQRFDPLRPFYRIELRDIEGTHWYVSSVTGEFVQKTTASQRFWNYFGAVAHWIYPTLLRKHWALWDSVVWWLSGFGVVCAVLGFYLGVSHWNKVRRIGRDRISAFRGWMKWHHVLGLCTGLIIVSWIVSGWLSMDHGRLFSLPDATAEQKLAIQGRSLAEAIAQVELRSLDQYRGAKELDFFVFDGKAQVVAKMDGGLLESTVLEIEYIAQVIDAAFPETNIFKYGIVPIGDTYTHLREGSLAPGTIRVELTDPGESWLHIDPHSGQIISVVDRSRRVYRWLYNGLHSLDFPGLANRRPLWDVVMLILLLSGFVASVTGVVIGLKRLRQSISN